METDYLADTEYQPSKKRMFRRNSYNQIIYEGYLDWLDNDHTKLQVSEKDVLNGDFDYKCGYCLRNFDSRNQLFNHLGFCNVNINNSIAKVPCISYMRKKDLPKNIKKIKNRKRVKFLRWAKKEKEFQKSIIDYIVPTTEQEKANKDCDDLTKSFTKIRINKSILKGKNDRNDLIASMRNIQLN